MNSILRKTLSFIMVLCLAVFTFSFVKKVETKAATSYVKLESIGTIDPKANYVLGTIDYGFHYSGTTKWGLTQTVETTEKPFYRYTLTASEDGTTFTAKTTIDGTVYYLTIPATSNTFTMSTSETSLMLGVTSHASGDSATICNATTNARHLRYNTSSKGLRSYAGTTGVVAYFYKEVVTTDPAVTISDSTANMMVGDEYTFVATEEFITVDKKVWSSSDSSIATVDETTGEVTAVSMGLVDITVTINDSMVDTQTVAVYPSNEDIISIESANEIIETLKVAANDTTATEYAYKCYSTVLSVSGSSFVIGDEQNNISAYQSNHGLSVGDKVLLEGKLINYNGSTKQFNYPTITKYYTVTFDPNNGSTTWSEDVIADSSVNRPTTDPTNEGFTFNGWFNGASEWDFTSVVTENITLTANWISEDSGAIVDALNAIKAHMSLSYKYVSTSLGTIVVDTINHASIGNTGSYGDYTITTDSNIVYTVNSYGGNSNKVIQIRNNTSIPSGIIMNSNGNAITKIVINWYSGNTTDRTVSIYGKDEQYSAISEIYSEDTAGTLIKTVSVLNSATSEIYLNGNYKYIGLLSSGAVYIESIEVTSGGTAYSDVDFRIKAGIDKGLSDNADVTEYGIEVTAGSQIKRYYSTGKVETYIDGKLTKTVDSSNLYKSEEAADGKEYVVISLGDVLNNFDNASIEFTVKAFVVIDGGIVSSTSEKTYSVKDMVDAYYANSETKELVAGAYAGLNR